MFVVLVICESLFLWITEKIAKNYNLQKFHFTWYSYMYNRVLTSILTKQHAGMLG